MELKEYLETDKERWDTFLVKSKNGTFLFYRNYIDYHSNRFQNNNLLFEKKGKLRAMIPVNLVGETAFSHQGITYGGFILPKDISIQEVSDCFNLLNDYLCNKGVQELVYKPVPYIYHKYPSQEDLYALYRLNAAIIGRNISSTIDQSAKLGFTESRKSGLRKSKKENLEISTNNKYKEFWNVLEENLSEEVKRSYTMFMKMCRARSNQRNILT